MALSVPQVASKVQALRARHAERDGRMADVKAVRDGRIAEVFADVISDVFPKPIVANFVDTAARDLAEVIAPLPSLNCSTGNMGTDKAKKFAGRKSKVGAYYWQHSLLEIQMVQGADWWNTYGFMPISVEPDFDAQCPRMKVIDPWGCYPEFNRWGECISFAQVLRKTAAEWAADFPDKRQAILNPYGMYQAGAESSMLEVIRFSDADQMVLFMPARENLLLAQVQNPLGRCLVTVAVRPGLGDEMRGQFDDVIWVQMARARMSLLALEATEKSVQAPLAVPDDIQEMPFGPDALIRTANPDKIRRVGLEMSPSAFAENQILADEMRLGARYPEGRSGQIDASVITGRGVQALLGGFDTQVKTAQLYIGHALQKATELCFEMDEMFWPNISKTIRGVASGNRFDESYTPLKDIAGDYTCDVTYGFAAGMDPNRALVFLLQLHGDHLITRDFVQRHLPMEIDVVQLQQDVDVEETRDALKQGVFAMAQNLGAMIQNGMDPSQVLSQIATLIARRQKGDPLEDIVLKVFAPPAPPETGEAEDPGLEAPVPGGLGPNGLPPGVAQGQAGQPPGGQPTLQMMMAGLRGGRPQIDAAVSRRIPA